MADVTVDVVSERVVEVGAVAATDQQVAGLVGAPGSATSAALNSTYAPQTRPAWASGSTGPFDSTRQVYNWNAQNTRKTTAALGRVLSGGAATFGCIGDSETKGFVESGKPGYPGGEVVSWPKALSDALVLAGYPLKGFLASPPSVWPSNGFSFTGSVSEQGNFIILNSGGVVTYVSPHAGTIVEVPYFNNGRAFTVAIDGAAAVTVTPTGASTIGKYTVTGLADTTHTVVITGTASNCFVIGPAVRRTTGLEINNFGRNGSTASSVGGINNWEVSGIGKLRPTSLGAGPTTDLWFISLGINDLRAKVATATIKAAIGSLIAERLTTADVILVTQLRASTHTDATAVTDAEWDAHMAMQYELADQYNVPLIDMAHVFGTPAQALAVGTSSGDSVPHPSVTGYALNGRVVARVVS